MTSTQTPLKTGETAIQAPCGHTVIRTAKVRKPQCQHPRCARRAVTDGLSTADLRALCDTFGG